MRRQFLRLSLLGLLLGTPLMAQIPDEFTNLQRTRAVESGQVDRDGELIISETHSVSDDPTPETAEERLEPIVVGGGPIE